MQRNIIISGLYINLIFNDGDKNYHTNQCLCSIEYELHSFVKVTSDTKQCKCKYMVSTPSQELN